MKNEHILSPYDWLVGKIMDRAYGAIKGDDHANWLIILESDYMRREQDA